MELDSNAEDCQKMVFTKDKAYFTMSFSNLKAVLNGMDSAVDVENVKELLVAKNVTVSNSFVKSDWSFKEWIDIGIEERQS